MKATINKSVVFKSAWKMVREYALSLSEGLKKLGNLQKKTLLILV